MPKVDDPNEEAASLDARLSALEARRSARPSPFAADKGASEGYRVLADLIGGVLGGLGLGWLLDRYVGTAPFGLIGGLLIGTGFSVFLVVRNAGRLNAKASQAPAAVASGADDDEQPGVFGPRQGDD